MERALEQGENSLNSISDTIITGLLALAVGCCAIFAVATVFDLNMPCVGKSPCLTDPKSIVFHFYGAPLWLLATGVSVTMFTLRLTRFYQWAPWVGLFASGVAAKQYWFNFSAAPHCFWSSVVALCVFSASIFSFRPRGKGFTPISLAISAVGIFLPSIVSLYFVPKAPPYIPPQKEEADRMMITKQEDVDRHDAILWGSFHNPKTRSYFRTWWSDVQRGKKRPGFRFSPYSYSLGEREAAAIVKASVLKGTFLPELFEKPINESALASLAQKLNVSPSDQVKIMSAVTTDAAEARQFELLKKSTIVDCPSNQACTFSEP